VANGRGRGNRKKGASRSAAATADKPRAAKPKPSQGGAALAFAFVSALAWRLYKSEWSRVLVLALALVIVLRSFLFQTFVITSGSMENTLLVGDFLVVNRAAIGSKVPFTNIRIPGYSEPRRGDILVFDPHHEENLTVVKRLVGVPGDTLEMRNKVLYLNGAPQDEPYVIKGSEDDAFSPDMLWQRAHLAAAAGAPEEYRPTRDRWGPIVIPEGRYFMLGDNRDSSLDSRFWGFLEGWRFEGRAVAIYFSYNKGSFRPFPWVREIRASRIGMRVR